jgi:pyruvate formate lyase activating enzyme
VSNEIILANLDFLYNLGARIILRCPLVPGVNDSRTHLEGIAAIAEKYPDLEDLQILPFHDMGRDKYRQIGKTYPLGDIPTADAVTKEAWIAMLHRLGCTRAHLA